MRDPYTPPAAPARREAARQSIVRPLVAFLSGLLVVPAALFILFSLLFPNEVLAYGNASFWCAVLIGSVAAAALAMAVRRIPLWLLILLGPMLVFTCVVLWIVWMMLAA